MPFYRDVQGQGWVVYDEGVSVILSCQVGNKTGDDKEPRDSHLPPGCVDSCDRDDRENDKYRALQVKFSHCAPFDPCGHTLAIIPVNDTLAEPNTRGELSCLVQHFTRLSPNMEDPGQRDASHWLTMLGRRSPARKGFGRLTRGGGTDGGVGWQRRRRPKLMRN